MQIFVDPSQGDCRIVRAVDEQPACLISKLTEAAGRVSADEVLVALHVFVHRAQVTVATMARLRYPPLAQSGHRLAKLNVRAFSAQTGGINCVYTHAGTIGIADHGAEIRRGLTRDCYTLGKEE